MPKIIDSRRLEEITGGDAELAIQIYNLMSETIDRCVSKLEDIASGRHAFSHWFEICHELRGAAANIGADILQDVTTEAETCDLKSAALHLEAIKKAADELKKWMVKRNAA